MKKRTKSILLSAVILCILVIAGIVLFLVFRSSARTTSWQPLDSLNQYAGISEQPITKITLWETADSITYVEFEDQDLIQQWSDYLSDAQVKQEQPAPSDVVGGVPTAYIQTETGEYALHFGSIEEEPTLEIDGYYFTLQSSAELPFQQTYDAAKERYGTLTIQS